jgi:hypothetical protein
LTEEREPQASSLILGARQPESCVAPQDFRALRSRRIESLRNLPFASI